MVAEEYTVYEVSRGADGFLVSKAIGVFGDKQQAHNLAYERGKEAATTKNGLSYRIQSNAGGVARGV